MQDRSVSIVPEFLYGQTRAEIQAPDHLFDVFGEHIAFQVDAAAGPVKAKTRVLVGVRDDRDGQELVVEGSNGEADPVDSDGSFEHQVAVEFFRHADTQPPVVVANGLKRYKFAGAVYVALHDVAAEASGRRERPLEVDTRSGCQFTEVRALQGFGRKIGGEGA